MTERLSIVLAGNPNSGKSTLFNGLTGAHQHVGNYPGVTVEKKEGLCRWKGYELLVVDLPGTYSLTAYSVEELVARPYDHADLNSGAHGPVTEGRYSISWNVTEDAPVNNVKTIAVTLSWQDRGNKSLVFNYYKADM